MSSKLPLLTTMMLDALARTLPHLPQKNRAATVARCIFSVYVQTHGAKTPWQVTGETVEDCEKRVQHEPVTIVDTTAEVVSEETSPIRPSHGSRVRRGNQTAKPRRSRNDRMRS